MIPEGWERTTIGEHVHVLTGFAFKSSDYSDGPDDIRLLRGDNVAQNRIRWRDAKKLPQEKAQGLDRFALKLGDFVIALDRTWIPAGVKIAEVNEADLPSLLVQRVARLRSKPRLEQSLMRQFFGGHGFEQYVKSVQTETAVPHISPNDLRDLPILLPPLQEQKHIAETLEIWDRAIETVEALTANARAQKQALMQQLLPQGTTPPKKRLPGFSGEWRDRTIKQFGKVESGGTPASGNPAYWGGDIAWVTPGEITKLRSRHLEGTERTITKKGLGNSSAKLLPIGTVIVCTRATVGILAIATTPMTTNQGFKNIVPSDEHDSEFLYYLLTHNKKALIRAAAGSTFAEISKTDFEKLSFAVPKRDEQRAIASMLIDTDGMIERRSTQLTALRQEKAALMQQLLTGKRRVKLPESEVV